jgi:hypothetical protein
MLKKIIVALAVASATTFLARKFLSRSVEIA